jgi:molybdopterin synthase catalytic subunit
MKIELLDVAFDPWQRLAVHQAASPGKHGATAVFVGTMRDSNEGDAVQAMHLEHYHGMTEKHLEAIAQQAAARWPLLDTLILHRIGQVFPGDAIVLVATWSAHRAAAYEANRYIMEDLKSKAPFWKKEQLQGRERWVEHNTSG